MIGSSQNVERLDSNFAHPSSGRKKKRSRCPEVRLGVLGFVMHAIAKAHVCNPTSGHRKKNERSDPISGSKKKILPTTTLRRRTGRKRTEENERNLTRTSTPSPPRRRLDTDTETRTPLLWLYRLFSMARSGSSENRPRDPPLAGARNVSQMIVL